MGRASDEDDLSSTERPWVTGSGLSLSLGSWQRLPICRSGLGLGLCALPEAKSFPSLSLDSSGCLHANAGSFHLPSTDNRNWANLPPRNSASFVQTSCFLIGLTHFRLLSNDHFASLDLIVESLSQVLRVRQTTLPRRLSRYSSPHKSGYLAHLELCRQ